MSENDRRRHTAHEMWLQQLTPEQRGQYELDHAGEVVEASPEVLAAVDALNAGLKYPCHRRHEHETWCLPVDEMGEALQRSIERRD